MKKLTLEQIFCWYYLAVSPAGQYGFVNANQLSKVLNITVDELMADLKRSGIHPDQVVNTDFPLAKYQVELQLLSEESQVEERLLARSHQVYLAWQAQRGIKRDWLLEIQKEREQDRERARERALEASRERARERADERADEMAREKARESKTTDDTAEDSK